MAPTVSYRHNLSSSAPPAPETALEIVQVQKPTPSPLPSALNSICPRADTPRDCATPGQIRHRPAACQKGAGRRGNQPLQAFARRPPAPAQCHRPRRARPPGKEQHSVVRPDRLRQNAAGADAGSAVASAVRHRRRHDADRGPATSATMWKTCCCGCCSRATST